MISSATDAHMRRLVKRLSGFDVHIIYTARDLSRVATAMWQTGLRSTQKHTWEEYARSLKDPDNDELTYGKRFWFQQGADSVLARWGKLLPHENLHLITVPRPGNPPELLWQRFCAVVGLDPLDHMHRKR